MFTSITTWRKRTLFTLLVSAIVLPLFSQKGELQAEAEQSTGLHSNGVRCIKIDPEGRTWVGTDNGLNIFSANSNKQTDIIKLIGSNSVWGIEFFDSLVVLGTRLNGLYIINYYTGRLKKHYQSAEINDIRKIRLVNERIYVITNNASYLMRDTILQKLYLTPKHPNDFIIDVFSLNNKVYGLAYPSYRIMRLDSLIFDKDVSSVFLGEGPQLELYSHYCAFTYNNKVYLGSSGIKPVVIVTEEDKEPVFLNLFESNGPGFIIWDIIVSGGKIYVAVGDTYSNTKGGLFEIDINTKEHSFKIENYVTCLSLDTANKAIFYGTLDKGVFLKRTSSNIHTTNSYLESEWLKNNNTSDLADKWKLLHIFKDTLIIATESNVELYSLKSKKLLVRIRKDPNFNYGRSNAVLLFNNSFYTFDNYGKISSYDLLNNTGWRAEKIESALPYPQVFDDKIFLLNREKGFNLITKKESYALYCGDKSVPFINDFTVIADTLYTLSKNNISKYFINYQNRELKLQESFINTNATEGFSPKWILSHNGILYLANDRGMLQVNTKTGVPINYYYLGNFSNLKKPEIEGNNLILFYNDQSQIFPFSEINNSVNGSRVSGVQLDVPISLNENLAFEVTLSHPQYIFQNRTLKSLQIWRKGKLKETKYSITSVLSFPEGLKYGDYDFILQFGNHYVKQKVSISLPLNRNPYFFGSIALLIAVILLIWLKLNYDKKTLKRRILDNRLHILKQNLNPHFVYNSMNLISSLILEEKYDEAILVVSEFSKLQRSYLETNNKDVISLQEEIDFIEVYLKLQQRRFENDNSFIYNIKVEDNIDLRSIMVPPLILQPLVENAIKHGIIESKSNKRQISIEILGSRPIIIGIEDNGMGYTKKSSEFGMGQKMVTERIELFNQLNKSRIQVYFNVSPKLYTTGYRVELIYDSAS